MPIGNRIGATSRVPLTSSISMPMMTIKMLIISRTKYLLLPVTVSSASRIMDGTLFMTRMRLTTMMVPSITMITPVVTADSLKVRPSSLILVPR